MCSLVVRWLAVLAVVFSALDYVPRVEAWSSAFFGGRISNFATHGAARVAFDVVHQDICPNRHSEVCAVITWSCYEANEHHNYLLDRRAGPRTSRWYFLDIEGERETLRFEMRKATTMNPTARLIPFRNYTARVYSIYQEHVMLLRNFTFETIIAAPSVVQQLMIDVLDRNVAYMPRARKLNISWTPPQEIGANSLSGYMLGLYKKPEFNFRAIQFKNITIMEIETNHTWHIVEPISFYERKLFIKVVPYNLLHNGSQAYGPEIVADVYLRSQYSRELSVNSVGGQSVDIEIDQDIFKDVIEAGLVTNISVFVSPIEMFDLLSWKAADFTKAVVEDKMKRKQIRAVFQVSPLGWNLSNAMDRRRPDYTRFPCFQGGDRKKVVCSIGVDEKCDKLMYTQICNAPLIKDMNYTVFVRAHFKRSNYLPEYDDSKPLPVSLHSVAEKWISNEQLFYPERSGLSYYLYKPNHHNFNFDPRFNPLGRYDRFDNTESSAGRDSRYDSTRKYVDSVNRYENNNPFNNPGRFDPRFDPNNGGHRGLFDSMPNRDNRDQSSSSGTGKNRFDANQRYRISARDGRRNEDEIYEEPYGPVQHIPEQP